MMTTLLGIVRNHLVIAHSQVVAVDQPTPTYGGPGASAVGVLLNALMWLAGMGLVGALIWGALMWSYGHFGRHEGAQIKGLHILVIVLAASILVGGAAAFVNFGTGLGA